jgi:hypothetical protein
LQHLPLRQWQLSDGGLGHDKPLSTCLDVIPASSKFATRKRYWDKQVIQTIFQMVSEPDAGQVR